MTVNFTFINCLIQNGVTWWKTTRVGIIKIKSGLLSLLHSWFQSKPYEKSTAQTSFFHLKKRLMRPPFCCKTHSRRRHHSLIPDACETSPRLAAYQDSPTCTKFAAVEADRGWPLFSSLSIHCCCRLFSNLSRLVMLNITSWNSRSSRQQAKSGLLTVARLCHFVL